MSRLIQKFKLFEKEHDTQRTQEYIPDYKIREYIKDDNNFPELENIKNIFEDIYDFCFINNNILPHIETNILRLDENNKIKSIQEDTPYRTIYYKSFRALLEIGFKNKNDEKIIQFDKLVESACKRIENYGFFVKEWEDFLPNRPNMRSKFIGNKVYVIHMISKTDSITIDEILKAIPNKFNDR